MARRRQQKQQAQRSRVAQGPATTSVAKPRASTSMSMSISTTSLSSFLSFVTVPLGVMLLLGAASAADDGIPIDYTVVHANVVMRHGERTRLVKSTEYEFGDHDGVLLTLVGEEESYNLGKQLRERYMPTSTSENVTTTIEGLTLWYDADRVQVESTGYDRTLQSAAAMLFGLYPVNQEDEDVGRNSLLWNNEIVVPIHSSKPQNDPYIAGFDKCPVYDANWIESYEGDEFQELQRVASAEYEDGSPGFITQVYEEFAEFRSGDKDPECWSEVLAFNENLLELHAPYNLWDCAGVFRAEGIEQPIDFINAVTIPTGFEEQHPGVDNGWRYLTFLVHAVEDIKFEQGVVGRMAGGLYLTEMHLRMSQVIEHIRSGYNKSVGRFPGMHISSGHYGTLKGLAGALNLPDIHGIPPYASHLSFELLYNGTADHTKGEDDFGVRIMYQNGTSAVDLNPTVMRQIWDVSASIDFDEGLATARDLETSIMPWTQWDYLMDYQNAGGPVVYEGYDDVTGEQEWCLNCEARVPDVCLALELSLMTEKWEQAETETQEAVEDKEAVDDGVGGTHVALLSIFGVILGIGIGICVRPCVDRYNKKLKRDSNAVAGDTGLEAWSAPSRSKNNGSFRLGSKNTPTRNIGGKQMMGIPSTADDDLGHSSRLKGEVNGHGNGNGNSRYDIEEDVGASGIPVFAPTSALGEPVPFPHKRQTSGMVSGVDSSMMTGIDADEEGDDDLGVSVSRELLQFK